MSQEQETHIPRSYNHILAELNQGRSWDVIYGVHGLSDNPRVSPYADLDTLCNACAADTDCPGVDNTCLRTTGGDAVCAAACTDDTGCPDGYKCRAAAEPGASVVATHQCVPESGSCR